ncbi:MAG: carbohydrate kinase [Rhodoglobus sp.]|nr:carbohydrate kinase [Rhodoglobus sp.]
MPVFSIGVDIGSTTTKASLVAVSSSGSSSVQELATLSAPTPSSGPALVALVAGFLAELARDEPPAAIGIASMAETGAPLDGEDTPLTDLVRWDGARWACDIPEVFAETGVPATPKAPLVTWLRRDFGMTRWAGVADLVALALTGELVTDHTLAGRTMAYRLPEAGAELAREFDAELLALAGLRPSQLPEVRLHSDPWPVVSAAGASLSGVLAGTPVVVAGHDHSVGAWGSGVRASGQVADSIGTTEALVTVLGAAADRAALVPTGMSLVRTVEGRLEAILGGSATAGAAARWWVEREYEGSFEQLMAELAGAQRHPAPIVLPYLAGRQCPRPDASARFEILNGDRASRAQLSVAFFDALAFQARWMFDVQQQLSGFQAREITVLGAPASQNPVWLSVKAALMPPLNLARAAEPVAAAAALLAAVRAHAVDPQTRLDSTPVERPQLDLESPYSRFLAAATGETR